MNELYVPEGRIYFKTNKTNAKEALEDLVSLCDKVGIELCADHGALLRNEDGDDIDECEE